MLPGRKRCEECPGHPHAVPVCTVLLYKHLACVPPWQLNCGYLQSIKWNACEGLGSMHIFDSALFVERLLLLHKHLA